MAVFGTSKTAIIVSIGMYTLVVAISHDLATAIYYDALRTVFTCTNGLSTIRSTCLLCSL
jgi:hypothetical protein